MLDAFDESLGTEVRKVYTQGREIEDTEIIDANTLGHAMLLGYVNEYGIDEGWEVIHSEQTFQIDVPDENGNLLVVYCGRWDGIWRNIRTKNFWIVDHKGLKLNEKILTPNGWKENKDLEVGDLIIGSNGQEQKIEGVYDLGKKEFYRVIFDDGIWLDTTDDHLWEVTNKHSHTKVITTMQLKEESQKPRQEGYKYVRLVKPVQFQKAELPIDPYTLGVLLGDGGITRGVTLTCHDKEIVNRISKTYKVQESESRSRYDYCTTFYIPELKQKLKELGLLGLYSDEKFIPKEYLFSSIDQRIDLLKGLMDTDGNAHITFNKKKQKQGFRARYTTTSEKLAEDIRDLVWSLGGRASLSSSTPNYTRAEDRKTKLEGRQAYHLNISIEINPFYLPRKAEKWRPPRQIMQRRIISVEYIGEDSARCIKVSNSDGLYIAGDFVVTHNTRKSFPKNWGFYSIDSQAGSYLFAAPEVLKFMGIFTGEEIIDGLIFNCLRKAMPDERPRNSEGRCLNKNGSVSKVQPPPFFHREVTFRSPEERVTQYNQIVAESIHMEKFRSNELPIYKNQTEECNRCILFEFCEADERGYENGQEFANHMLVHRDPYADHILEMAQAGVTVKMDHR